MKVLLNTDVVLDVLLRRDEHYEASATVLDWAEAHPGRAALSCHSLANVHYLSRDGARDFIAALLEFCEVPSAGRSEMQRALRFAMKDLEDAMQVAVAEKFGAQVLVTRNITDYKSSPIKALTPAQVKNLLD